MRLIGLISGHLKNCFRLLGFETFVAKFRHIRTIFYALDSNIIELAYFKTL